MAKPVLSPSKSSKRQPKKPTRKKADGQSEQPLSEQPMVTKLTPLDDSARRAMIAEAAYYRAERRGFAPGLEVEDWLQSENEIDAQYRTVASQQGETRGADLH